MTLSADALLTYWRAALLDGNRHIDPESLSLYPCGLKELASGQLDNKVTATLWAEAQAGLSRRERERMTSISVVVALPILQPEHHHSAAYVRMRRNRVLMWLGLRADRNGNLHVGGSPEDQIIVDRAVLSPLASKTPTFATVKAVDDYAERHPAPTEAAAWREFWTYVEAMFAAVFGAAPEALSPSGHVNLGPQVACGLRPADVSWAIRTVYETLIKDGGVPPLLATLAAPLPPKPAREAQQKGQTRGRHLGQMGGGFPLNQSQRRSLDAVLAAGGGEIVAVNGPPGTGKTTFIQSVVASLWVERALEANGEPPVILASSTNNKAITNILDTFARATLPAGHPLAGSPLVERWLPEITQYGLYLPSKREAEKGIKGDFAAAWCHQHGQAWSGLPGAMENDAYLEAAELSWLARFGQWAGSQADNVEEAIETLRQVLTAKAGALQASFRHQDAFAAAHGRPIPDLTEIGQLRAASAAIEGDLRRLREVSHAALQLIHGSFLEALLSWVPAIRRRLWTRAHAYLEANGFSDPSWTLDTVLTPRDLRRWLSSTIDARAKTLARQQAALSAWESWMASLASLLPKERREEIAANPERIDERLDTLVRPELFHLAARYWEGRWLIETRKAIHSNLKAFTGRDRETCERRWRRFAKLTPCLVSTAYTAPRLLDYYRGSTELLTGFADLLIVDEAGQVPPQVGGALFALARKALVVGDTQQIEPVWGIDADTDLANIEHFDLSAHEQRLKTGGMLASEGSVMAMAQSATAFADTPHRGLFLEEHWRCRAPVIAYCNELAYGGALKPMRPQSAHPLPPIGYAHVPGRAIRAGTSWTNADEASVLAKWLARRKTELLRHHGARTLGEIVAIVTPFRAQIAVLDAALKNAGLDGDEITAGTVHTLQGAEKAIVLFSSVYAAGQSSSLFFDRGVSMLNVAVSRARESFLVFGDIRLFRPQQPSLPSGLLGVYLFSASENEITDIDPVGPIAYKPAADLERLSHLDAHRAILRKAITEAQRRLLIVSPYLSSKAIEADQLSSLLAARSGRLQIVVAYDQFLNAGRQGRMQPAAMSAVEMLQAAGVELWALNGAHNKTLAVDDDWIVEGSFNWLSAQRDRGSDYQRHEVSFLYRGEDAATHVSNAWQEIESLRHESGAQMQKRMERLKIS